VVNLPAGPGDTFTVMTALAAVCAAALGLVVGRLLHPLIKDVPARDEPSQLRSGVVEVVTASLFAAIGLRFGASVELVPYLIGTAAMVALSFIDLETYLLPKKLVWPAAVLVLLSFVVIAAIDNRWDDLQRALLGGIASTLAVGLMWFIYPRGMGFGDVRLMMVLGMLTGWQSRGTVLAGFALAFVLGGALSMVLLVTRLRGRKDAIPFGPWLCLGCMVAILWTGSGEWIESRYISPAIDAYHTARS
jgi:leader peptidase (prepilin peptidase)/N-methyltransferase